MKVAIVSTGLGHIARGVEAWAVELARGLAGSEHRRQRPEDRGQRIDDSGQKTEARRQRTEGVDITLFGAAPIDGAEVRVVPTLKRGNALARLLVKVAPAFTWRWGWTSEYAIEQKSFARHMIPIIEKGNYDVVHTQDVVLALELEKARNKGVINVPTILAHGTDEDMELLSQFEYLQHLSPEHAENFKKHCKKKSLPTDLADEHKSLERKNWIIPNFVSTKRFRPKEISRRDAEGAESREKDELRSKLGIADDSIVIGCSAALQFHHKRLDYLIKEISATSAPLREIFLLLAGASTDETSQVEALAKDLLGDRCKVLKNLPFNKMPEFYRALDVYVHPAAEEFFGICFLEAMACGVPVVAHDSETLRWIVGEENDSGLQTTDHGPRGGMCVDMNKEGGVAEILGGVTAEWIEEHGQQARERVETIFSWEAVESLFLSMYEEIISRRDAEGTEK